MICCQWMLDLYAYFIHQGAWVCTHFLGGRVMDGDAHPMAALVPLSCLLRTSDLQTQLPCFLFLAGLTVEVRKISAILTFKGFKKTNSPPILKHRKASYHSWLFLVHLSHSTFCPWLVSPWTPWGRLRSLPFSELSKSKEGFCYLCKPYSDWQGRSSGLFSGTSPASNLHPYSLLLPGSPPPWGGHIVDTNQQWTAFNPSVPFSIFSSLWLIVLILLKSPYYLDDSLVEPRAKAVG